MQGQLSRSPRWHLPCVAAWVAIGVAGAAFAGDLASPESLIERLAVEGLYGPASQELNERRGAILPQLRRALSHDDRRVRAIVVFMLVDEETPDPSLAPALTDALLSGDTRMRGGALRHLGDIGPAAAAAPPAIRQLLPADDKRTRIAAHRALCRINGPSTTAVSSITALISDANSDVHREAVRAAPDLGIDAAAALPALVAAVEGDTWYAGHKVFAVDAIAGLGAAAVPAIPVLRAVRDGATTGPEDGLWLRTHASLALVTIDAAEAPDCVPRLVEAMRSRGAAQGVASRAFEAIAPEGLPALLPLLADFETDTQVRDVVLRIGDAAIPALAAAQDDGNLDERTRAEARLLLMQVDPRVAEESVSGLMRALASDGATRQVQRGLRAAGRPAVDELVARLVESTTDDALRDACAEALGGLLPRGEAVSALLPLLAHDDAVLREAAAGALGHALRDAAPPTWPPRGTPVGTVVVEPQWLPSPAGATAAENAIIDGLIPRLVDQSADVRGHARYALADPWSSVPFAVDRPREPRAWPIVERVNRRERGGPGSSAELLTWLAGHYTSSLPGERNTALRAVFDIAAESAHYVLSGRGRGGPSRPWPEAALAVARDICGPGLVDLLDDAHPSVRLNALATLALLDPESIGQAAPVLRAEMAGDDARRHVRALGVLRLVDPGHEAVVPILAEALGSAYAPVRRYAAHVLGLYGSVAVSAAPELAAALSDSDWSVRADAAVALSSLGAAEAREALASYRAE